MASATSYIDGDYSLAQAVGAPRYVYPFRALGDRASAYFEQDYWQLQANWTPQEMGTRHDSLRDFYLIAETQPVQFMSTLYQFTRTWARIPATQTVYGSQAITKPNVSAYGTSLGNYYNTLADMNAASATGKAYSYLTYAWAGAAVYGPKQTCTSVTSGSNRRITCTGHGVTTQDILITNSTPIATRITSSGYTVVDANTIDILNNNTDWTGLWVKYRNYGLGTSRVRTKQLQYFYLPGVSTGITTAADISLPGTLLDDSTFLASAVANLSGFQTYDSTAISQWMGTPIYTYTAIQINMADL